MALTSGQLNPNAVLSGLDEVFFSKFNLQPTPDVATPFDALIFNQSSTDRAGVITEVVKGGGLWTQRGETEDLTESAGIEGDKRTFSVANFAQSLPISKHFFDDEQYDIVRRLIAEMGKSGQITDYQQAFGIFRGAFTTTLTNNGTALISDTQANLNGDVIDNKLTAALSNSSLEDAIVKLGEQKSQSGMIVGHKPKTLLVPLALYKDAVQITESKLEANTADNQMNVYSAKYGLVVKTTPYLGAAAGGSDTAWFLLSDMHNVYRWERQPIVTDLVDYKYSDNFSYKYKAEFRNVYGAVTYEGVVGSLGNT